MTLGDLEGLGLANGLMTPHRTVPSASAELLVDVKIRGCLLCLHCNVVVTRCVAGPNPYA